MNITIYCGANPGTDPAYLKTAELLGKYAALHGHTLVYGAGKEGLMGTAADAALALGGRVIGVIPRFMVEKGWCHEHLTERYVTETMAERKKWLMDLGDVLIALPGGVGTLEELSEAISSDRLGLIDKPVVLFSTNGYYEPLKTLLSAMVSQEFLEREAYDRILISEDMEEIERYIAGFRKRCRGRQTA